MINLYQILNIPHYASAQDIQAALQRAQEGLDPKAIKAINEWLLVPDVRARYDAKLRQEQPDFFMTHAETTSNQVPKPKIVPANSAADDDEYMDLPPLWNPKAAMWWSVFFNVVLGAVLHAKNWEALGEKDLAKQNWIWAGVGAGVVLALMLSDATKIGWIVHLALVFAWYHSTGNKQVEFFKKEFGEDYERKGWLVPIILTVLAIIAAGVLVVMIAPENIILYVFLDGFDYANRYHCFWQ